MDNQKYNFKKLKEILKQLRAPNGCPWDKEQTSLSLIPQFLEEVYELIDALYENSSEKIMEELGDVLLHVIFQIIIAEEKKRFKEEEVFKEIIDKIIRRHPHVFGDLKTNDINLINKNWEEIKRKEKGKKERSLLDGVPKHLPELSKAYKLTKEAAKIGFDWPNIGNIFEKLNEELTELEDALIENNKTNIEEEIGDVFFMLVNLCRNLKINPEEALRKTNYKFIKRFNFIEQNVDIYNSDLEEMDKYWEKCKK
jgi:tetrapyrrole methylase family protein/MazG family protein